MEPVLERGIGLVFWFSGYKVVEILSSKYSQKKRLMIYIGLILVTLIIIYKIEQRRDQRKVERAKEKDALLERCIRAVAEGHWPDHE